MSKKQMLLIAEKNIKVAQLNLERNKNRKGIKDHEIEMLENKIVYMQNVYDLIKKYYEDPKEEV
jgi:hypothetical protein